MSEPQSRYTITLRDLRARCPLLASIEVRGYGPSVAGCQAVKGTEELVGLNAAGGIVVRAKGKITPRLVKEFQNSYQLAVHAGILKPKFEREAQK